MKQWQWFWLGLFWAGALAGAVDLPPEVTLREEVRFEVKVPDSAPFFCTLNPGVKVQLDRLEGEEVEITYMGRIKLSGVGKEMFAGEVKEPVGSDPGRAVLAQEAAVQLARAEGERAGTVELPQGGVVEVLAMRGDKVDIQLPRLQGKVPVALTDLGVQMEAAKKAQAEWEAEVDRTLMARESGTGLTESAETLSVPSGEAKKVTVTINTARRFQTLEGFGTCLITWLPDLRALYQTRKFQETYVRDLGFNVLRVELAGATLPEPVPNVSAIRYTGFAKGQEITATFTEFAKAGRRLDPNFKVIATVWSPPAWMKASNHRGDPALQEGRRSGAISALSYKETTNYLKKEFYPHFVRWMVEYAKLYQQNGTPLYAISPGNEVMFTQWFQSCTWTAEDFATIVRMLGEALEKEGLGNILIFGPETMTGHNYPGANREYIQALTQPKVLRFLGAFATHAYVDGVKGDFSAAGNYEFWEMIEKFRKPYWITEGGTGGHGWPQPLSGVAAFFHNNLVHGNASLITPWQVTDVEPNEHGLMVRGEMTKKTRVAQHYTRFLVPGSTRVEAKASEADLRVMAAIHPEGRTTTVVAVNPSAKPIALSLNFTGQAPTRFRSWRTSAREDLAEIEVAPPAGGPVVIDLPAQSIVTVQGS